MSKPFILGINASPFEDGIVAQMLGTALDAAAKAGGKIKTIHLSPILPHDDGRRQEETHSLKQRINLLPNKGRLRDVVKAILEADAVIFATPTRCFNASSRMMALLSWLMVTTDAPEYPLAGKVAAFMAACEEDGGQAANEKMLTAVNHLGFIIPPFCTYFYNKFATESEGDWQTNDRTFIGRVVVRMVIALRNVELA